MKDVIDYIQIKIANVQLEMGYSQVAGRTYVLWNFKPTWHMEMRKGLLFGAPYQLLVEIAF